MKKALKKQIALVVAILSATILMVNNVGQALTLFGISVDNAFLNWLAVGSLLVATYYFVFIK